MPGAGPNAALVRGLVGQRPLGAPAVKHFVPTQSLASAARVVARLPDKVTPANVQTLKDMRGIDDEAYKRIKMYVETGQLFTDEEEEAWEMELEGWAPFL